MQIIVKRKEHRNRHEVHGFSTVPNCTSPGISLKGQTIWRAHLPGALLSPQVERQGLGETGCLLRSLESEKSLPANVEPPSFGTHNQGT